MSLMDDPSGQEVPLEEGGGLPARYCTKPGEKDFAITERHSRCDKILFSRE
jgi:hypothetical protein